MTTVNNRNTGAVQIYTDGAGLDDIKLGSLGSLNNSDYTEGSAVNKNTNVNNGKRVNFLLHGIPPKPWWQVTLTGAYEGSDYVDGSSGSALRLLHNQDITKSVNNSLFVQTSTGHVNLSGEFYGEDTTTYSSKQFRIVDAVN